jgi:hypothetical protein
MRPRPTLQLDAGGGGFRVGLAAAVVFALCSQGRSDPAPTIHYAPSENLEHVDVALIDRAEREIDMAATKSTLRTGAANFSASGLKRQDNDLIIIESAAVAAAFRRNFDAQFTRGETLPAHGPQ